MINKTLSGRYFGGLVHSPGHAAKHRDDNGGE